MEDNASESVVPSAEKCRTAYEKGFRIWQSLYVRAMQASGFPDTCFQFQQALLHQPYFPDDLNLELTYDYLSVSGSSIWIRSQENSQKPCYIPPLERHLQIPVSIKTSAPLSISAGLDQSHQNWFNNEENHLPVLVSAWSYIFSARWAALMPKAALAYTDCKAYNSDKPEGDDSAMVNIGVADDDAARWWPLFWLQQRAGKPTLPLVKTNFDLPGQYLFRQTSIFPIAKTTLRSQIQPYQLRLPFVS